MRYTLPSAPLLRWVLASRGVDDPEIEQRLVATIFSGTSPLLMAGLCELIVGVFGVTRHPGPLFAVWIGLGASLLTMRLVLLRRLNRSAAAGRPTPTTLVVILSLAWISVTGFGCLVCDLSGDTALQALSNVCVTALLGGLIARNAGTPRLVMAQVAIALSFICLGAWLAPQHWLRVLLIQAPLYAMGLMRVCLRINGELVALHKAQRDNAVLARQDPLTGLPNRMLVAETLDGIVAQGGRASRFAVLAVDLDGFKAVNDSLGHAAGDAVLIEVSRRLRRTCDDPLLIARLGGDEFLVALRGPQAGEAEALARRIGVAIAAPFLLPEISPVRLGASFGVAHYPDDGVDAGAIMIAADKALYAVKRSGKGSVAAYDPCRHAGESHLLALRGDLDAALQSDSDELELHYQSVVGTSDRAIVAREALLRWRHPARGLIGPADFIPVAEASGLIVALGERVLRQACLDAAGWAQPVSVAVNVSPVQLRNAGLAQTIAASLALSGLPAARLEIEVTETALLGDDETTRSNLLQLHGMGVRLVLDDFGTGYSSLSSLCRFSFDAIKIDGSFVREALHHRESAAVIRATAALARELGVPTTAECVETGEQLAFIRAVGCDHMQGYLFDRPTPNAQIAQARPPEAAAPKRTLRTAA